VTLPLDKARALVKELSTDLNNYDEEQARKAAEKQEQEVTDE
jgi:hypothetical protein